MFLQSIKKNNKTKVTSVTEYMIRDFTLGNWWQSIRFMKKRTLLIVRYHFTFSSACIIAKKLPCLFKSRYQNGKNNSKNTCDIKNASFIRSI